MSNAEKGAEQDGGMGLIGIRERAALIGGTVEIESQPGAGTTVIVRVPSQPPLFFNFFVNSGSRRAYGLVALIRFRCSPKAPPRSRTSRSCSFCIRAYK
jgi:hypothetical protein